MAEPKTLQREGRKLWRDVMAEYDIADAHQLRLLESMCCAWDRVVEARQAVEETGPYITNRHGELRPHPGLKIEEVNRKLVCQIIRELGLNLDEPKDTPRRPRTY